MPCNVGTERRSGQPGLALLLSGSALGSGLLLAAMPGEGREGILRLAALLPLQLAAMVWVPPRRR